MSRATTVNLSLPDRLQRRVFRAAGLLPPPVLRAAGKLGPVNSDGERLAAEMLPVTVATARVPGMALHDGPPPVARKRMDVTAAAMAQTFPPFAVEEDLTIDVAGGTIGATRYRAQDGPSRGLVVFYHGGGFVLGSRASHDSAVRALAVASGADVLSVDYRLAPEFPFPTPVDDALAAWRFAVDKASGWGLDRHRIAVAGDSAGGNLSAVVSQLVRGEDVTPCLQLLIYPVTDLGGESASRAEFAEGFFLTQEGMDYFTDHYIEDRASLTDPRVSPMLTEDLSGLPPAYVVVAGFDPLRDEGIAYAEKLRAAGVPVTLRRAGNLIHGFINMTLISPSAREEVARMGAAIVEAMPVE
ncbi:alpha/beta hydrolase [Gordonia sp. VNK21]|uniref:alpha/beta hydrolase n=1 Tax=Gordonia sp. VNK21 TaxID=3382483 RepID=UPI0038D412FA